MRVVHPSHPLSGQVVKVIRQASGHPAYAERCWVVELADRTHAKLPLSWAVEWSAESGAAVRAGEISLDLTIVYCEIDKESVCLLDRVRIEVPVTLAANGERDVHLTHTIRLGS